MGDQRLAAVEPERGDIWRAAPSAAIRRPVSRSAKAGRERKAQVAAPQFDPFDPRSDHRRLEAAPHRLDFRQFRHRAWSRMTARNAAPYFCSLTVRRRARRRDRRACPAARFAISISVRSGKDDIGGLLLRRAIAPRRPFSAASSAASASCGSAAVRLPPAAPSR